MRKAIAVIFLLLILVYCFPVQSGADPMIQPKAEKHPPKTQVAELKPEARNGRHEKAKKDHAAIQQENAQFKLFLLLLLGLKAERGRVR